MKGKEWEDTCRLFLLLWLQCQTVRRCWFLWPPWDSCLFFIFFVFSLCFFFCFCTYYFSLFIIIFSILFLFFFSFFSFIFSVFSLFFSSFPFSFFFHFPFLLFFYLSSLFFVLFCFLEKLVLIELGSDSTLIFTPNKLIFEVKYLRNLVHTTIMTILILWQI